MTCKIISTEFISLFLCNKIPIYWNISKSFLNYLNNSIELDNGPQGITLNSINSVSSNYGVFVDASTSAINQISISNSQFNDNDTAIYLESTVIGLLVTNNYFIVYQNSGSNGIYANNTSTVYTRGSIVSNTFIQATGTVIGNGINLNSEGPLAVTGNFFTGLGYGIYLTSGSTLINVQSNTYTNNTTNVDNLSTTNTIGGGSS